MRQPCFLLISLPLSFSLTEIKETSWHRPAEEIVNRTLGNKYNELQWQTGHPIYVNLQIYVESITKVSTADMAFDVDVYLHMSWQDDRFVHQFSEPYLINDPEDYKHLWKPDLYFSNSRESQFHYVTVPNTYFRVYNNGEIFYSTRVSLKTSCNQNLRKYPMDKQHCFIKMLSYSYSLRKLVITWDEDAPMEMNPEMSVAGMNLVGFYPGYCNGSYFYGKTRSYHMHGEFSCLTANFRLVRQLGYHIAHTYIPTMLIVCISWVSFFIDPAAIPARISLSFTTLLTLSTLAIGVRNSLPPLDYLKAIDIWMGGCMAFLFMALIEFAAVNSVMRKAMGVDVRDTHAATIARRRSTMQRLRSLQDIDLSTEIISEEDTGKLIKIVLTREKERLTSIAMKIDRISQFLFPTVFAVLNFIYWFVYLS